MASIAIVIGIFTAVASAMIQKQNPTRLLVASFYNLLTTIEAIGRHVVTTMNFAGGCISRERSGVQCVV